MGIVPVMFEWGEAVDEFFARVRSVRGDVLDAGGGRNPVLPRAEWSGRYVGLDLSAEELSHGEYSERVVSPLETFQPDLAGQFDLVVSFQVLEHVEDFGASIENIHAYLKPGGLAALQFSGRWSYFALLHRALPDICKHWGLNLMSGMDRKPFPAPYHDCYPDQFMKHFAGWESVEVIPIYSGAPYLNRARLMRAIYLFIERRVLARYINFATHYQVYAVK